MLSYQKLKHLSSEVSKNGYQNLHNHIKSPCKGTEEARLMTAILYLTLNVLPLVWRYLVELAWNLSQNVGRYSDGLVVF